MIKEKELYAILAFALVLRAFSKIAISNLGWTESYELAMLSKVLMYVAIGLLCIYRFGLSKVELQQIFGSKTGLASVLFAVALGLILFAFTLGENAVEILLFAHFDAAKAYRLWNFHDSFMPPWPFLSVETIEAIFVGSLIAPICEEFFFRGLLLSATAARTSLFKAILITSAVFCALHFSGFYYVSTFIFAVAQCCLYLTTRSLSLCIIVHGTYNFVVLVFESNFDFHFIRSVNELSNLNNWLPQLAMFGISSAVLAFLAARYWKSFIRIDTRK
jgi:membrane protease YdiL (CAAX protease family)